MNKKIYFISDLHLGATYLEDTRQRENYVVKFLMEIKDKASELYLMGDILDYWFEYKTVVPRGYIRFFGALSQLADNGVKITWFIGNHDIWIFDYLRNEIGLEVIDGYIIKNILGKKFFLSPGDGVGEQKFGFRLIRSVFRNKTCQKLYSAIHPRWTIPLAFKWSSHSRKQENKETLFNGEDEELVKFARQELTRRADIDFFIFGHRHEMVDMKLTGACRLIILGDWLNKFSYAEFDGENMRLLKYGESHN